MTLDPVEVGKRLREARIAKGWTLREAATRSGLSTGTISNAERARHTLCDDNHKALVEALGVDLPCVDRRKYGPPPPGIRGLFIVVARERGEPQAVIDWLLQCEAPSGPTRGPMIEAMLHAYLDAVGHVRLKPAPPVSPQVAARRAALEPVDRWNREHPVGSAVRYRSDMPHEGCVETRTTSKARLRNGEPMVRVGAHRYPVSLSMLEPIAQAGDS